MSFLGTFVIATAKVISMIINLYTFIILGAVIISWVQPDPYNPIVRFLHSATEPVFARVRKLLPAALFKTGMDFTPIIVLIALVFIETLLVGTLMDIGAQLRYGQSPYLP